VSAILQPSEQPGQPTRLAALNAHALTPNQLATAISTVAPIVDYPTSDSPLARSAAGTGHSLHIHYSSIPQSEALVVAALAEPCGSLRDHRYQESNQRSQILPITYNENTTAASTFTATHYLCLGQHSRQLQTVNCGQPGSLDVYVRFGTTGGTITAETPGIRTALRGSARRDPVLGGFGKISTRSRVAISLRSIRSNPRGRETDGYTSLTSDDAVSDPTAAPQPGGDSPPRSKRHLQLHVVNPNKKRLALTTPPRHQRHLTGSAGDTYAQQPRVPTQWSGHVPSPRYRPRTLEIDANSGSK